MRSYDPKPEQVKIEYLRKQVDDPKVKLFKFILSFFHSIKY